MNLFLLGSKMRRLPAPLCTKWPRIKPIEWSLLVVCAATLLWARPACAATALSGEDTLVTLNRIRYHTYPTYTRVVLDLSGPVGHQVTQDDASSLIVELKGAILGEALRQDPLIAVAKKRLIAIRALTGERQVRVLLELSGAFSHHAFTLQSPDRLVLDVFDMALPKTGPSLSPSEVKPPPVPEVKSRPLRIVIDPGHGGKDPGAVGQEGLTEKTIALDVSFRLAKLLRQRPGWEVYLTRDHDVFISLKARRAFAKRHRADIFLSVHVNAHTEPTAQGIEMYLFGRATDKDALSTAARENATSQSETLNFQKQILTDMVQDFTRNQSLEFAHHLQRAFSKQITEKYATNSLGVKRAPFYVLAKTDMPAALSEIGFISNPKEARRLSDSTYRQEIAETLYQGVSQYRALLEDGG